MKTLGERIRELREQNDLSLREFAKKINLSAPFVSDIELGRRFPSDDVLEKIAKTLGITTEELRAHDTRLPISALKKLAQSSPAYGIALRKLAEKKVSPEEIIRMAEKKEEDHKEED
ncbi:MAG: helix-turn-helix domain-containing protein [Leptospirillum sp.]